MEALPFLGSKVFDIENIPYDQNKGNFLFIIWVTEYMNV